MKIAITRREAFDVPDGINISVLSLAEELLRRGHQVVLVSGFKTQPDKLATNFLCSRLPATISLSPHPRLSYPAAAWVWWRHGKTVMDELKPDFIIVNGAVPVRFARPTCIVSHDLEARKRHWGPVRVWYKRYAYRKADAVAATCRELRAALASELRAPASDIHLLPTCVSPVSYSPAPLSSRERAILHVGTAQYKNPAATIRAFGKLADKRAKLYVTGGPSVAVDRAIEQLPGFLRERVHLLGYLGASDFRRLLSRVRVVSVPSSYRVPVASPTVLESLASGTPPVASGSISSDLVQHGVNALVCNPSSEEALTDAFRMLLEDEAGWKRLSEAALVSVRRFSAAAVADQYLELMSRLL